RYWCRWAWLPRSSPSPWWRACGTAGGRRTESRFNGSQEASSEAPIGCLGAPYAGGYRLSERLLSFHGAEEFVVDLEVLEFVDQELGGGDVFHIVEQLAQDPHALQFGLAHQQFFAAGAG